MSSQARKPSVVRAILLSVVGASVAVALALGGVGTTYALWNSSVEIPMATITAGTATLTVTEQLNLDGSALYPGRSVWAPVTVTNTGDVTLDLRASTPVPPESATVFAKSLLVGVVAAACSPGSGALNDSPTLAGLTASVLPAQIEGTTLAPDASIRLCVSLALPLAAAMSQGQQATIELAIDGLQVTP
jgi:predicted ribosomally synthesized peptide with SipW-like signal peptide